MNHNVGGIDRVARIVAGIALIALAATHQVGLWGWIAGAVVMATGVLSFCGLYAVLGLNTCPLRSDAKPME
jgi:Protein of unknown function (DUF2892)